MRPAYPKRIIIGWNERVDLPAWGIKRLRAKVDTGARTSALHVTHLEPLSGERVRFQIVLSNKRPRRVEVIAPVSRMGWVRSSSGEGSTRYFVRTIVTLGSIAREVEVNLVDREGMLFRMLLGRTALSGVLIDATRSRLLGKARRAP